jgi:hypothetical protein
LKCALKWEERQILKVWGRRGAWEGMLEGIAMMPCMIAYLGKNDVKKTYIDCA